MSHYTYKIPYKVCTKSHNSILKNKDINVPTKYVIHQQDIDKKCMFFMGKGEKFGSLAPLARNHL